jgi:hypothetical protein
MFEMIVFSNNGNFRKVKFPTEIKKVVITKYNQLVSEGEIAEFIVMNADGSPNLG